MKGTCENCTFWWKGDGFCSKLGIIRPSVFSCAEYLRDREYRIPDGDCASCAYYSNGSKFCKTFTIVVEPTHGCRKHVERVTAQLNTILDKLDEG